MSAHTLLQNVRVQLTITAASHPRKTVSVRQFWFLSKARRHVCHALPITTFGGRENKSSLTVICTV